MKSSILARFFSNVYRFDPSRLVLYQLWIISIGPEFLSLYTQPKEMQWVFKQQFYPPRLYGDIYNDRGVFE